MRAISHTHDLELAVVVFTIKRTELMSKAHQTCSANGVDTPHKELGFGSISLKMLLIGSPALSMAALQVMSSMRATLSIICG